VGVRGWDETSFVTPGKTKPDAVAETV
jgi:hypothetical protein